MYTFLCTCYYRWDLLPQIQDKVARNTLMFFWVFEGFVHLVTSPVCDTQLYHTLGMVLGDTQLYHILGMGLGDTQL